MNASIFKSFVTLFPVLFVMVQGASADLTNGLIGKWSFEDNGVDASPRTNHAVLKGDASFGSGTNGKALFMSSNGYADCGNGTNTSLTNQLTVAAWVYDMGGLATGTSRHSIVTHFNSAQGFSFDVSGTSYNPRLIMAGSSCTATGYSLPLSNWVHLAATYDGAFIRIYTNGYLVISNAGINANLTNAGNLLIGARSDGGPGNFWNGFLDEVHLYSRVLNDLEILDLRNVSAPGKIHANVFMHGRLTTEEGACARGVLVWTSNAAGTARGAYTREDGTFSILVPASNSIWIAMTPPQGLRIPWVIRNVTTPSSNFFMDFSISRTVSDIGLKIPSFYSPVGGDLYLTVLRKTEDSERVVIHFIPVGAQSRFRMADVQLQGRANLIPLGASSMMKLLTTGTYIVEVKIVPDGRSEEDPRNEVIRRLLVFGK